MKYQILILRDVKADLYKAPMFVPNINAAIRDLRDMVNDPNGKEDWQRHPEDFELLQSGCWDSANGRYIDEPPKQLLALSTLKND